MLKSIIVAKTDNQVIGNNNQMPWYLPNDLKYFRQTTLGHHVIMGRKTFESLPKLLPGRTCIIITHDPYYKASGGLIAPDLITALEMAEKAGEEEVFIAGGGTIYAQALTLADKLYLTEIKAQLKGDVLFPVLNSPEWIEIERISHQPDEQHAYAYDFVKLIRSH